jgi:putative tryptophan/tyrosine transport system substrate-binding protein
MLPRSWLGQRMQFDRLKRREVITLLSGAAAAWSMVARAQQAMPLVGFLNGASPTELSARVVAFRAGLAERGYVEGHNVAIEYRWGLGHYERLPDMAVDLVRRGVAVIAATGGVPSVRAARAATSTIPIVFTMGGDPVALGLVDSLNRPGGNVTGVTLISGEIVSKRIALLRDLLPGAKALAVLMNSTTPASEVEAAAAERASHTLGWRVSVLRVGKELDFDSAFRPLQRERVDALLVTTDPVFESQHDRIVALAAHHALPAVYALREYAVAGGLMTYGASISDVYRQAGLYGGRILKGEKPADLPIMQASKFELVINSRTARTLGIQIPATLLATSDEVIE